MTKKPDSILDLRGCICPLSLLKASAALAALDVGQCIEIIGTDAQTKQELFQILNPEEFRTIDIRELKTSYKIFLEKTAG
ncbi:MAG: sulfurtransferase TusA family protein [Deltaproteobacteria bacterium]|nr:sulfurtransferase TusA family protein [Deltaproteobacteria bacterium]